MGNDEVLRMRATVVTDEAISSLRNLGKQLGLVGKDVDLRRPQGQYDKLKETVHHLGRELSEVVPGFGKMAFGAAGSVLGVATFTNAIRDMTDRVLGLKNLSSDLGISVRELQAFHTAAEKAGVAPEAFDQGLKNFKRNTEDFKLRIGELRDQLRDFGAGDFVEKVAHAATTTEALHAAFDKIHDLQVKDPTGALARRFAEQIGLGADAARLSWSEFLKEYERSEGISKKQIEQAKSLRDALIDIGVKWDELKLKVGIGIAPMFTREVEDAEKLIGYIGKLDDWLGKHGLNADDPIGAIVGKGLRGVDEPPLDQYRQQQQQKRQEEMEKRQDQQRQLREQQDRVFPSRRGLFHPSSFGGESDGVKEGTKQGVIEGLLQFAALQGLGGGGMINAAFSEGGGGAGGAGGGTTPRSFGSSQFPNLGAGGARGGGRRGLARMLGIDGAGGSGEGGGGGINRDRWLRELEANPALKEKLFRHSLGENTDPMANQAIMEEAANRADIRGGKSIADKGNLSYFQGYYRGNISPKMRAMLDSNYRKVFREGSDVAKGAIDNSSSWLAAKHERTGAFKAVANYGGDRIAGHPGVETFQIPGTQESGRGERSRYPAFRRNQLAEGQRRMDQQLAGGGNMKAEGTVNVNVHAPRGTKVAADSDGLWQSTTVKNYRQMQPTEGAAPWPQ